MGDEANSQCGCDTGSAEGSSSAYAIAKLAVEVAATASPESPPREPGGDPFAKIGDKRLDKYFLLADTVTGKYDGPGDNCAYASCTQAVGHVVRGTVDPDMSMPDPKGADAYLAKSDKWTLVGTFDSGQDMASVCKPGDVLSSPEGLDAWNHTWMYVGNDLARTRFPDTDADCFQANISDASYPGLVKYGTFPVKTHVYRFTGKSGGNDHPYIDAGKLFAGSSDYEISAPHFSQSSGAGVCIGSSTRDLTPTLATSKEKGRTRRSRGVDGQHKEPDRTGTMIGKRAPESLQDPGKAYGRRVVKMVTEAGSDTRGALVVDCTRAQLSLCIRSGKRWTYQRSWACFLGKEGARRAG